MVLNLSVGPSKAFGANSFSPASMEALFSASGSVFMVLGTTTSDIGGIWIILHERFLKLSNFALFLFFKNASRPYIRTDTERST